MTDAARRFVERLAKGRGRYAPMAYLQSDGSAQLYINGVFHAEYPAVVVAEAMRFRYVKVVSKRQCPRIRIAPLGRVAVFHNWFGLAV